MEDFGFKFKIGTFVEHIAGHPGAGRWLPQPKQRGFIVARLLEECPGGVQRHYDIRWTSETGNSVERLFRHNEIELMASDNYPKPEPEKESA